MSLPLLYWKLIMSDEQAKTHTQGEVDLIKAMERLATLQSMFDSDFRDHKREDAEHFGSLYEADKKILQEISLIPDKINKCSDRIRTETLQIARNEFVSTVNFETFKGEVKETVAEVKGSIKTTTVVMGIIQSVLLIILAAWVKTNS